MKHMSRQAANWGGRVLAAGLGLGLLCSAAYAEDPLPSEMMDKAPKSLLLDIDKAGSRYVAVGERGHVLVSADGQTFVQKPSPTRATLTAVDFVDGNKGWAVGHDAVIQATSDGGETWTLQNWNPELEKPLLDVLFLDAQRGFAVGAYGLLMSTSNGGGSWTMVENSITLDEWHFTGIAKMNDGALVISGEAGGLAMSRDEGASWVQIESPYEGSYFGVLPWGDAGALLFGLRGNVFLTNALPGLDEVEEVPVAEGEAEEAAGEEMAAPAAEWTRLESGTVQSFMGGTLLPSGGALVVGVNGVMMKISADGTPKLVNNPVTLSFSSVIPLGDGKNVLVTGEGGTYPYNY